MAFENKVKRRPWTQEEKQSALKSCASRCACCGTKLTMKTLTMEHVVPISKGGENVLENLVVLCNSCNAKKGNKFYWPLGFYMALNDKSKLKAIDAYTNRWVSENITQEHFEEFPLISEAIAFFIKPKNMEYRFKNGAYIPSLIMDLEEVNDSNVGILNKLGISRKYVYSTVRDSEKPFSLLMATKRGDGECVGLFTIQNLDNNIFLNEVWTSSTKINRMLSLALVQTMCETWSKFGSDIFIFRCKDERVINELNEAGRTGHLHLPMRYMSNPYDYFDYPDKEKSIYGRNQILIKTISKDEVSFTNTIDDVKASLRAGQSRVQKAL